ncbi:hypothetical protein DFR29_103117 [Tahibacter aquaticus]|uniref:Uncharacterized protein n=1 Tax=Tahibacter aquaticus TaxID=520092 RepID=A0A4R6Z4I1_9GAMM|nr:hypothetical protein DFR29_103117 [Tahibacter aquaticus]
MVAQKRWAGHVFQVRGAGDANVAAVTDTQRRKGMSGGAAWAKPQASPTARQAKRRKAQGEGMIVLAEHPQQRSFGMGFL